MSKTISLVVLVLVFSAVNNSAVAQNQVKGIVRPMPTRHFQGSPTKDWFVSKIHVSVGSQVKAGQCLLELDPGTFAMERATAQLNAARTNIVAVKARLEVRQQILERAQRLMKTGASSKEDVEEKTEAVKVLKAELAKAEAEETVAKVNFDDAEYDNKAYQRINSPINGEVVAINCSLGLVARAEFRQIVWIEIIDSSVIYIHCFVSPESALDFRKLLAGKTPVDVVGTKCKARVIAVPHKIVDGKSEVILEAKNSNWELVSGQEVKITFP